MAKIRIPKKELDNIIQEEATKFKKALELKSELKRIQSELKQLNEGEINEVQAGENMDPKANDGVHAGQKKPKFSTKKGNPFLKMEETEEEVIDNPPVDVDTDMDMTDTEVPADTDSDSLSKAAVWQAIEDLKMALNLHDNDDNGEVDSEEVAEVPVEADEEVTDVEATEETPEETENEESEEDEVFEFEENQVSENKEEPIEGGTPAQHADEDTVNDNMDKVSHPEAAGNLMEAEKKRMAILAGIMKG
jgi:hypothetical protein